MKSNEPFDWTLVAAAAVFLAGAALALAVIGCDEATWRGAALDVVACTAERAAGEARSKGRENIAEKLDAIVAEEADAGAGGGGGSR